MAGPTAKVLKERSDDGAVPRHLAARPDLDRRPGLRPPRRARPPRRRREGAVAPPRRRHPVPRDEPEAGDVRGAPGDREDDRHVARPARLRGDRLLRPAHEGRADRVGPAARGDHRGLAGRWVGRKDPAGRRERVHRSRSSRRRRSRSGRRSPASAIWGSRVRCSSVHRPAARERRTGTGAEVAFDPNTIIERRAVISGAGQSDIGRRLVPRPARPDARRAASPPSRTPASPARTSTASPPTPG